MSEKAPDYVITRVDPPANEFSHAFETDREFGGQREWFWGLPGVFHALAAPQLGAPVPAVPRPPTPHDASANTLGYWLPLQYLMMYRLGWSKPDQGLRAWIDAARPVDDPTLRLIEAVWVRDATLDHLLAWLVRHRPEFLDPDNRGPWAHWPSADDLRASGLPSRWAEWLRTYDARPRDILAVDGGWDPLHLSGHSAQQGETDPKAVLTISSRDDRRAIFTTSAMDAWYWDLADRARSLPELKGQSWRVDVFVKPVGFLGTYRQSRETGLWFAGRHRFHMWGN